jgi:hypothetical protein
MIIDDENPCSGLLTTILLKMINPLNRNLGQDSLINYGPLKKPDLMPELKLKQLQYENDTWKRLLGCMLDENVRLKNRLSEVLKIGFDRNLLEDVENFQTRFIIEDERVGLLRHEVVELDKLLSREIIDDGKTIEEIKTRFMKQRNNIVIAEKEFSHLKMGFNKYLSENI